jgi:thioredoxin reductase
MIDVAEVTAIVGRDRVTGVAYLDMKGAIGQVAASAVFVAAGRAPVTGPVSGIVAVDGSGHVTVDDRLRTSAPGVFATGDVRSASPASVLAAMADGRSAAIEALHHLSGNA